MIEGFYGLTFYAKITHPHRGRNIMRIHQTLREAREWARMSQEDAAGFLGISGASFSRMEAGLSAVTTTRLFRLAQLYQVSASSLLEGVVVMQPSTIDMEWLRQTVIAVETVVAKMATRPSPEKIAGVVAETYRREIDHILNKPKERFTPDRHTAFVELMFTD
ncbi:helix-turn-helix domain-containing protein [Pseudogemmobacter sp. W21_MBD1_M6]|uniref:helix-turn-helix domain-containing protein n=1 Tax=Pseudogemmobacter sp. W21_MBD1_M6 TaxID=3240271 RepID=UPI003F9C4BF7